MDLLQTLLVYMSLVFASSVQTAPAPEVIPPAQEITTAYTQTMPVATAAPTAVPPVSITPNPAYGTLKMGDKGAEVTKLQQTLKDYGYYTAEVDGAYGNQTRVAVEKFQYMHGLSADGMAGRHTLTVLYESNEIRLPDGFAATPEPTAETKLAVAFTPTPTPEATATPVPTATPAPTATPEPEVTAEPQPTAAPVVLEEIDDCKVLLDGAETGLKAYKDEETVYVPVLELLKAKGIYVISSSSLEMDEYAFADGLSFVRFTHTENQRGEPVDLKIYSNDVLKETANTTLYSNDGVLYMSAPAFETLTGMTVVFDEEACQIVIIKTAE